MSKKTMLEKLELYSGKVVKELTNDKGFMCRCRYSHIFKYTTIDDWCLICKDPNFQQTILDEMNTELSNSDNTLLLFAIDEFGIGEFICTNGHVHKVDIDDIPNSCSNCKIQPQKSYVRQATNDTKVWSQFVTQIKNNKDREYDSLCSDSIKTDIESDIESDIEADSEMYPDYDSVNEHDEDPMDDGNFMEDPMYDTMFNSVNDFSAYDNDADPIVTVEKPKRQNSIFNMSIDKPVQTRDALISRPFLNDFNNMRLNNMQIDNLSSLQINNITPHRITNFLIHPDENMHMERAFKLMQKYPNLHKFK